MTPAPQSERPVSTHLERQLTGELRSHGHVLWLDKDGHYTAFVDGLAERAQRGGFSIPVVGYRGSFLETMLALEPYGSGLDKTPLLVHVPGHNKSSIRATPLLETYESAHIWERALPTVIREAASGRVAPEDLESFLAGGTKSLEEADRWLYERVAQKRHGLDGQLAQITAPLLAFELLTRPGHVQLDLGSAEAVGILRPHLARLFGLTPEWYARLEGSSLPPDEIARTALWSWLLCVEYVHDLVGEPATEWLKPLRRLSPPLLETCRSIVRELRARAPDDYVRAAEDVAEMIAEEQQKVRPQDLGKVDTFRFEVARIFEAALEALRNGDDAAALAWASARVTSSFWLGRDQAHRWEWTLLEAAARLGKAISDAPEPLKRAITHADAVEAYTRSAWKVDRAHRHLEQHAYRLLDPALPHLMELRRAIKAVRERYRGWADELGRAWARLCADAGHLPEPSLRQRSLFAQVVEPLVRNGEKVAYFVVDALRWELAAELADELRSTGTQIELGARFAELPTLTAVGMNALAPVELDNGRLAPVLAERRFKGFRAGERTISTPEDRANAMGRRLHGSPALLLKLGEVAESTPEALKKTLKKSAGLVVVHGTEIDDAGEAGFGVATFEQSLRQIRSAFLHLQAAGIRQFVLTSDHGFLLQDDEGRVRTWGTARDPFRRHVVLDSAQREQGTHCVSFSALGYEGADQHLVFHDDTSVFATGKKGATFVHGGNSLQERLIPVLTVARKRDPGIGPAAYEIDAKAASDLVGQRRLQVRVDLSKTQADLLGFAGAGTIELALRVAEGEGEGLQVVVKDVGEPGTLEAGRIRVPVGQGPCDVLFTVQGQATGRVRVELFHPGAEKVKPWVSNERFEITWSAFAAGGSAGASEAKAAEPADARAWLERIEDKDARAVFSHLADYPSITEAEATKLLGSPRLFRRFAINFEKWLPLLPFEVTIEIDSSGKVYVKGAERDAQS